MPGDMHETNDSAVQIITVTKASVPDSVGAKDCTTTSQNDGMLTGVDNTMEYKAADGDVWIAVTGNKVTGLKPGTYLVRVKAEGTKLASASVEVTIHAYTSTTAAGADTDGGNTHSPRTGDPANILLWFSIVLAAGAVLTGTAFYRRIKC